MQNAKVVITLDAQQLQQVESIVLDNDQQAALTFVKNVIKPAVDTLLGKGHCKPVFEWRHSQPEKIQPPPIKNE